VNSESSVSDSSVSLVWPAPAYLAGYVQALQRGWSPDNVRPEAAAEELEAIAKDSAGFLTGLVDQQGAGPPIRLPDGSAVRRLPGYRKWIWDGEFCGSIGFRWSPGTNTLPAYCLGHIGYSVVPWKQRRGYATEALRQLLPEARAVGLTCVEIITDPTNEPSQRVVLTNGGVLAERFRKPAQYGGVDGLRFRIDLS
jgi:predicted acetyltransferase